MNKLEKKNKRPSQSPKVTSVTSNRTHTNKQAFLSSKGKRKVVKTRAYMNQANLTDTESSKMHDLLKKGYTYNNKNKRALVQGRAKSKSASGSKVMKNKLKSIQEKGLSNSRSPNRGDSRSTDSNRKIKSTIASSDIRRSNAFRNSGELISVASEKPKAVYFKNTLESHNKIKLSSIKNSKFSYTFTK